MTRFVVILVMVPHLKVLCMKMTVLLSLEDFKQKRFPNFSRHVLIAQNRHDFSASAL
jgi:hypothetical protein